MAGEDKHSKKHPATDKKKRDLKKKGTVAKSQDVPMVLGLIAAFGAIVGLKTFYFERMGEMTGRYIASIGDVNDPGGIDVNKLLLQVLVDVGMLSLPVLFAVMFMAVIANLGQSGLIITGEQMKPNLNKINPVNKLKQWFSIKSAQELFKSLGKILMASVIGFFVWRSFFAAIAESVKLDAAGLMALGGMLLQRLFIQIIILYVVIALVDYMFQRKNFNTEHKMTDKEVRDEYKNSEGDPHMKGKRRQMAQQISQQASAEAAPAGDVTVINPTDLAVVLKYDADISPVPYVIAKGEHRHADDIRDASRRAGVPVVRNKPLARGLYELCEIGDIVPEDLYRPVAEVLAYVFALKEQAQSEQSDAAAAVHEMPVGSHA